MPIKLAVLNARMVARAFCDQCGDPIETANLAHCAYLEQERLLVEREGEAYEFAVLHKGECTDRFEIEQGRMSFMEFQAFIMRLGNDARVDWRFASEVESLRLA